MLAAAARIETDQRDDALWTAVEPYLGRPPLTETQRQDTAFLASHCEVLGREIQRCRRDLLSSFREKMLVQNRAADLAQRLKATETKLDAVRRDLTMQLRAAQSAAEAQAQQRAESESQLAKTTNQLVAARAQLEARRHFDPEAVAQTHAEEVRRLRREADEAADRHTAAMTELRRQLQESAAERQALVDEMAKLSDSMRDERAAHEAETACLPSLAL